MKVNLNPNLLVAGHRAYVEKNSPEAKGLTWLLKLIQSCFKDRFTVANVHDVCFRRAQAGNLTPEQEHLLNEVMAYCHANKDVSKEEFMHAFSIVENDDGNLALSPLPRNPYINEYPLFENQVDQSYLRRGGRNPYPMEENQNNPYELARGQESHIQEEQMNPYEMNVQAVSQIGVNPYAGFSKIKNPGLNVDLRKRDYHNDDLVFILRTNSDGEALIKSGAAERLVHYALSDRSDLSDTKSLPLISEMSRDCQRALLFQVLDVCDRLIGANRDIDQWNFVDEEIKQDIIEKIKQVKAWAIQHESITNISEIYA